jgi:triosephosphate isomerase
MRRPLVAGNWKQNGSRSANAALLEGILRLLPVNGAAEVLVCPPFVFLAEVRAAIPSGVILLGAQDISAETGDGAFTGEISGRMLIEVGCSHVIVGHSERRTLFGDTDAVVARKFAAARAAGLQPILCVGETLQEREAGVTADVIRRQLNAVMDHVDLQEFTAAVIAYEPVWAIGTGRNATPDQAQEVHRMIRALVAARDATMAARLRILYGGSVKASNAGDLFAKPDIDGGLIGGASLNPVEFARICQTAEVKG